MQPAPTPETRKQVQPPRVLSTAEIQQKLEENAMLIKAINERQSLGHLKDCVQYQQKLQENLLQLAALADAQADIISLTQSQVDVLFGKLGTHAKCAGATLWLRDAIFADFRGRKVTFTAPSRSVAAAALRTLLYQLSTDRSSPIDLSLCASDWLYMDHKGIMHGPYSLRKMKEWATRHAFPTDTFPVQHAILRCWVPLWFLLELGESSSDILQCDEAIMADWEETAHMLNEQRDLGGALAQMVSSGPSGKTSTSAGPTDFPELQTSADLDFEAAAPMDYELSHSGIPMHSLRDDVVKAFIVVDTNILISHLTFTEHVLSDLNGSSANLELMVIVPWIVLCELDKLKASRVRATEQAARLALRRLRILTSERDRIVHSQTATEHARVLESKHSPNITSHKELRNDDVILQVCIYWRNGPVAALRDAGHRSGVILLSNDRGLCLRAEANGIRCFTAAEFPSTASKLAAIIPPAEPVLMDESEATPFPNIRSYLSDGDPAHGGQTNQAEALAERAMTTSMDAHLSTNLSRDDFSGHSPSAVLPTSNDREVSNGVALVGSSVLNSPPVLEMDGDHRNSSSSDTSAGQVLVEVIERCLGPGIKYYRQQDLGDLWLELLEDKLKPPWSAADVLSVLCRHSSTFWKVLTRQELNSVRQLAKWLHDRRRNLVAEPHAVKPAELIVALLQGLRRGLDSPTKGDAPDPSTVPDFISLGDARAALEEGIAKISLRVTT